MVLDWKRKGDEIMNKCDICFNRIIDDFCSMHSDMNLAQYRQCVNWKAIISKPKLVLPESVRKEREIVIEDSKFNQFLKKGGAWSFNNGKFFIEDGK